MRKLTGNCWLRPALLITAILLIAAGCDAPAPRTSGAIGSGEQPVPIQQTVVAQQGQIAALQDQITALQTSVAARPTAAPTARPPVIPTTAPIVQGLQVNGTTKGLATAKVVLDEYSDFQ